MMECENCGKMSMVDAKVVTPTETVLAVGYYCLDKGCGIFVVEALGDSLGYGSQTA